MTTDLLHLAAVGILDPELMEAFRRIESTGSLFNDSNTIPVEDADGNLLEVGQIYTEPNGKKIRITDARFGSGNIMDTWYWVFGIDENLKDTRITVDVKHRKNLPAHYPSRLRKVDSEQ